jgi:hypothetical protein
MRRIFFAASLALGILLSVLAIASLSLAAETAKSSSGEIVVRVIDLAGAPQGRAKVSLFRVGRVTRLSSVAKRDQVKSLVPFVFFVVHLRSARQSGRI